MTTSPYLRSRRIMPDAAPVPDAELMLPWYAVGTLDARDARTVRLALSTCRNLSDDLALAHAEQAEIVALGEALGRPSRRPLQALFAAIDAESADYGPNVVPFPSKPCRGAVHRPKKIIGSR